MWRLGIVISVLAMCACGSKSGGDGDAVDAAASPDASGVECVQGVLCGNPATCCNQGRECIQGLCAAACASGVRCGVACCDTGDVCVDAACATPGAACIDSFDCPEGQFCEPTLEQCLPQPTGPLCEVEPQQVDFDPTIEWHWSGYSADPDVKNVAVAPAIADIDNDGIPEIAFGAYAAGADSTVMLFVINGEDGSEQLAVPATQLNLNQWSGLAVGNLDGDAELEILAFGRDVGVTALDHDGTVKWSQAAGSLVAVADNSRHGYVSLANLDGDPAPEVVVGGVWIDNDGTVLQDRGMIGCNSTWCMSAVADLNEDGLMDIIGGNIAWSADGTMLWENTAVSDGFPAVADIDMDGAPDVVTVSSGELYVLRGSDGSLLFGPVAIPGGGNGGAPTVADFDGDGRPEFSSAGRGFYTVYDLDCLPTGDPALCASARTDGILWEVVTQDLSSSITGSSVFDFEGDGSAEVLYNDECHLYVLSGIDGTILLETDNTSRTAAEYPLVVDVDGDNNSEFIVPANNDQIDRDGCMKPGTAGIYSYGDTSDKWVRTRAVWNQHTYHVTNVTAQGEVPAAEPYNWDNPALNNFRQNTQGEGIFNAPDLVIVGVSVNTAQCPSAIQIEARVGNEGSLGVVAGVPVGFYQGTPPDGTLLGYSETTIALLPGQSELLSHDFIPPAGDTGPWDFYVVVDDESAGINVTLECAEDNNQDDIGAAGCVIVD